MTNIEMKPIPGFKGRYSATRDGRIYSHKGKKFRKGFELPTGYQCIIIMTDGVRKHYRIHRLIALTYLPIPSGYTAEELDVGHRDDNPQNNTVDNLYWCTRKENLDTDHYREATTHREFTKVRCVETGEIFKSQAEAGRAIGRHKYGINLCLKGKQKTCGGYHWERVWDDEDKSNQQNFEK